MCFTYHSQDEGEEGCLYEIHDKEINFAVCVCAANSSLNYSAFSEEVPPTDSVVLLKDFNTHGEKYGDG